MMEIDLFLDMSQDNLLFSLSVSVAWKSKIEEAGGAANLLPEVTKPLEQTSTTHLLSIVQINAPYQNQLYANHQVRTKNHNSLLVFFSLSKLDHDQQSDPFDEDFCRFFFLTKIDSDF